MDKAASVSAGDFALPGAGDVSKAVVDAPVVLSPPAFDAAQLADATQCDTDVETRRAAVPVESFVPLPVRQQRAPAAAELASELVLDGPRALLGGAVVNAAVIRVICCDGIPDDAGRRAFVAAVNLCVACQVLQCRGSRLAKIAGLSLPSALVIDLSNNLLDTAKHVSAMVAASPKLQVLDLTGNKVATKLSMLPSGVPTPNSGVWEWVAHCPDLWSLNRVPVSGHGIAVVVLQKAKGDVARAWQMRAWDDVLASRVVVGDGSGWAPAAVTTLNVSGCGLMAIFVGGLSGLISLDVTSNRISSLACSGLHSCVALESLSAGANTISDPRELEYLGLLPSLRELVLAGNPVAANKRFRQQVIWVTRGSRGTRAARGLSALDDTPVTYEERCSITRACAPKGQADALCWTYCLVASVGQGVAFSTAACAALVELNVAGRALESLNLGEGFPLLEALNASDNNLTAAGIASLRHCARLRLLDLHGNARLSPADAVRVVATVPLAALRAVKLARNARDVTPAHVAAVIAALASRCKHLRIIDGEAVPDAVRADALVAGGLLQKANRMVYLMNVGIAKSSVPVADLSFWPVDVAPGGPQYAPGDVEQMHSSNGCGLTDSGCAAYFTVFIKLVSLNLADNMLRSLSGIGLDGLASLELLDVRNNALACPLPELGALLQSLPALRAFAFRGNPCSKKLAAARLSLLSAIPRMRELHCPLQVIDSEISIDDRVKAMQLGGCSEVESEGLRGALALWRRAPRGVPPGEVKSLDLDCLLLKFIDLTAFTSLTALRLRGNELGVSSGLAEVGIGKMTSLRVLDLRGNRLRLKDKAPREAVFAALSGLTQLEYLGLTGNDDNAAHEADVAAYEAARSAATGPLADAATGIALVPRVFEPPKAPANASYWSRRAKLLVLLRDQFRQLEYPLRFVDTNEVTVPELVTAAFDDKDPAREQHRFDVTLRRALRNGTVKPQRVVSLDLSECALCVGNFAPFTSLLTLAIASNKYVLGSGTLVLPPSLTKLDLRTNAVKRMSELSAVLHKMSSLVGIGIAGNPCCDTGGSTAMTARVKLLCGVPTCRQPGWRLQAIDGVPVTVDERMMATEACTDSYWRLNRKELARTRSLLVLEEKAVTGNETELVLSKLKLEELGALTATPNRFLQLTTLDVSNNRIGTIRGQGLSLLVKLETLDLSNNA